MKLFTVVSLSAVVLSSGFVPKLFPGPSTGTSLHQQNGKHQDHHLQRELMKESDTMVILNQAGYCLEEGCPPEGKEGKRVLLLTLSEQDLALTERCMKIDNILGELDHNIHSVSFSETARNYLHHLELMSSLDKAVPHTHAKSKKLMNDDDIEQVFGLADECLAEECTVVDKEAVLKSLVEQRHSVAARIAEIEKLMDGLGASKQASKVSPILSV